MSIVAYVSENREQILALVGQHLVLFSVSILFTVVIGLATAIAASNEKRRDLGRIILTITAAAQAVPSIAVVALVFLIVGIGMRPAIIALFFYSLVPIVFNATSGLMSIDTKTIEAARGIGLTDRQILWNIKFPMASPVIMAGIRSAATINVGTATVAAVIGGGGLGDLIFIGLKLNKNYIILTGALLTALIAIIVDTFLAVMERRVTPKGLKLGR